ncbi:heterokaryon incompatibility protein, partial [Colletotrichum plurivorum]
AGSGRPAAAAAAILAPTVHRLPQAVRRDGCSICAFFCRECLRSIRSIQGNPHDWRHGNGDPRLEILINWKPYFRPVVEIRMGDVSVTTFNFVAAPADWSKRYDAYLQNAADPRLIKFWVEDCEHQHLEHCASDTDFLPTRLIDLGAPAPEQNGDVVRIIDTAESGFRDRRYVALSHRWDKFTAKCPQSTTRNIIDHRKEESAHMGQVYGAAFCTVSASKDALDAYDRPEEGEVGRRHLARGGDEYLLQWMDIHVGRQDRENLKKNAEKGGYILRVFDNDPSDWEYMLGESALSGRGWTLQERQLSRRVIHVTRNHLLWECRTCRGSKQIPWTDQASLCKENQSRYRIKDAIEKPLTPPHGTDASDRYKTWYGIVWDYSNRLLTIEADKIPALAGLAETMAQLVGDEYIAGLWRKDLISGLLWKSRRWPVGNSYEGREIITIHTLPAWPGSYPGTNGPSTHSRPRQTRAPTWSWMSLDGPVVHWTGLCEVSKFDLELIYDPVITPRDVAVDWNSRDGPHSDRNPLTQAEGGRLTITGCLQPAKAKYPLRDLFLPRLHSSFWTDRYKTLHEPTEEELARPSGVEGADETIATALQTLCGRGGSSEDQQIPGSVGVILYDVVDDDMIQDQTIYVLALRRVRGQTKEEDKVQILINEQFTPSCIHAERKEEGRPVGGQVFGLALVPTGEAENEYRRVGVAEFMPPSWFKEENRKTIVVVQASNLVESNADADFVGSCKTGGSRWKDLRRCLIMSGGMVPKAVPTMSSPQI